MTPPFDQDSAQPFYVTSGTLPSNALSYIPRLADVQLLDGLRRGEFCYVLTSRQMGKSSLMVQTARRLRQENITCFLIDLNAVGFSGTEEEWYYSIFGQIRKFEDALEDAWEKHHAYTPLQRFMRALETVLLAQIPGPIVLFIDEIDTVRALSFSADEFFAGIRECHNRRAENPDIQRLSFCMLGVATPTDLMRDTRLTPFNIGRRIDLNDLAPADAAPLGAGLARPSPQSELLLHRVLYWTGGHPYLTQKLCQAVAENRSVQEASDVDRVCAGLFFPVGSQQWDDNLTYVREELVRTRSEEEKVDLFGLLDLYRQIRQKKRVKDDRTNPMLDKLRLSGVVCTEGTYLKVRNRIYAKVFDPTWVRENMPGAELRRQQAAFRKGVMRTLAISTCILAVMTGLAIYAFVQANRANHYATDALSQKRRADDKAHAATTANTEAEKQRNAAIASGKRAANSARAALQALGKARTQTALADSRLVRANAARKAEAEATKDAIAAKKDALNKAAAAQKAAIEAKRQATAAELASYIATLTLIQHYWETNDFGRVAELLKESRASKARGFEWGYWNRLSHLERVALNGHEQAVTAVAFSPDSRRLVTGSADGTARVWDNANGKTILTLRGHTNNISCVACSRDGKYIVTASDNRFLPFGGRHTDTTARIWDAASGHLIRTLPGPSQGIQSIDISPDSKRIIAGSWDKTIVGWDIATGKRTFTLPGHTDYVTAVAYSPDGNRILTGSYDKTAKIWDDNGPLTLKGHTDAINAVAFSPDGKHVVTGSADGTARVWDAITGQETLIFKGHTDGIYSGIYSVAFSPDSKCILSASGDHTAIVWNAMDGKEILTLKGHTSGITSVAFSPDGRSIATGSADNTARIWDALATRESLLFREQGRPFNAVAFSHDSKRIITAGEDSSNSRNQRVSVWDAVTCQRLILMNVPSWRVNSIAVSPDDKYIAAGDGDNVTRIWNAANGQQVLLLKGHTSSVASVAFSPDGKRIVTGSDDKTARFWDTANGRQTLLLKAQTSGVSCVAFSPDGKSMVTGSYDRTAQIWDTATGNRIRTLNHPAISIHSIVFSPDGTHIVTGNVDGTASIWNVITGQEILTLRGHRYDIYSVVFSPDGKRIVTGSLDHTAKVWDAATGRELLTLKGFESVVSSVAFSSDGKSIVTASWDGTVRIWLANFESRP